MSWVGSRHLPRALAATAFSLCVFASCARERPGGVPPPAAQANVREISVTAHAYNSKPEQTDGRPTETASGDYLRPGMRAIAVSQDLLDMGLAYGTHVSIEGLGDDWVVLDRMADSHRRAIDIYMGNDEAAAERFGTRSVKLRWTAQR